MFNFHSLISLPLFCVVTMLLLVPPTPRVPLSSMPQRASRSLFSSFFVRRMKLGKITPKRPSGLSASPPNWRRRNPTGQSSGLNSPPQTPGSPVSYLSHASLPFFQIFTSDSLLFQSWSRRSRPFTPQQRSPPGRLMLTPMLTLTNDHFQASS